MHICRNKKFDKIFPYVSEREEPSTKKKWNIYVVGYIAH